MSEKTLSAQSCLIPGLRFLSRNKANGGFRNRTDEIFSIDARDIGHLISHGTRECSAGVTAHVGATYHNWRNPNGDIAYVKGFCNAAMNLEHETVNTGYFRDKYEWRITGRNTYKETFRIIQNFTSSRVFNDDLQNLQVTGRTDRYRWFLINELYFKLVDHLDFMTGYKIEYDSNPWPTVEKFDTTIKSGIQFSF